MNILFLTLLFPSLTLLLMRQPLHAVTNFILYALAVTELILWNSPAGVLFVTIAWTHTFLMIWLTGWHRSVKTINKEVGELG
jgi:hypothetical protein